MDRGPDIRSQRHVAATREARNQRRIDPVAEPPAAKSDPDAEYHEFADRIARLSIQANFSRFNVFVAEFDYLCRCCDLNAEAQLLALLSTLGASSSKRALLGTAFFGGRSEQVMDFVRQQQSRLRQCVH